MSNTQGLPGVVNPGWMGDPSGRHQLRYFDGDGWTKYVADGGQVTEDPFVPTPPPHLPPPPPGGPRDPLRTAPPIESPSAPSVGVPEPPRPVWAVVEDQPQQWASDAGPRAQPAPSGGEATPTSRNTIGWGMMLMVAGPALALVLGLVGVGWFWLPIAPMLAAGVTTAAVGFGLVVQRPGRAGLLVAGLAFASFLLAFGLLEAAESSWSAADTFGGVLAFLGGLGVLASVSMFIVATARRVRRGRMMLTTAERGVGPAASLLAVMATGIVLLAVAAVSLLALIEEYLPAPGHQGWAPADIVLALAVVIWTSGLISGGLIGWASARWPRPYATAETELRRRPILLMPAVLLIVWSLERLVFGMAPWPGSWFSFASTVASLLMLLTSLAAGFLVARALGSPGARGQPGRE